jgi:hypothetical protein
MTDTRGWAKQQPAAYAHEGLAWQADALRSGGRILFEPDAVVHHYNRPGFLTLLRRNYRRGFSAIETKAHTRAARQARIDHLAIAYSGGLAAGGVRWIRFGVAASEARPRWE